MRFLVILLVSLGLAQTATAADLATGFGLLGGFGSGRTKLTGNSESTLAGGVVITTHIRPELFGEFVLVNGLQYESLYGESFFNDDDSINPEMHGLESPLTGWSSPLWMLIPLNRSELLSLKLLVGADLLWIGDHPNRVDPWYDATGINAGLTGGGVVQLHLHNVNLGAIARWRAFPGPIVSGWQIAALFEVLL